MGFTSRRIPDAPMEVRRRGGSERVEPAHTVCPGPFRANAHRTPMRPIKSGHLEVERRLIPGVWQVVGQASNVAGGFCDGPLDGPGSLRSPELDGPACQFDYDAIFGRG